MITISNIPEETFTGPVLISLDRDVTVFTNSRLSKQLVDRSTCVGGIIPFTIS